MSSSAPPQTRRIEPVYILDAARDIVAANSPQVNRPLENSGGPGTDGCPTRPAEQSSPFLRDTGGPETGR